MLCDLLYILFSLNLFVEVKGLQGLCYLLYTRQKKKRTTTIFPLRSPFNTKILIVMIYSFMIKSYQNLSMT